MSAEIDNLTQKVNNATTVEEGAIVLLNSLGETLRGIANDPAAINALAQQLDDESTKLAAAVVNNTSAAAPPAGTAATPAGQ